MTVQQLEQAPKLGRLYARAAITARGRRGDRLPDISYELSDVAVERTNLAAYADVCGFRQSDVLPPTYPHILGFPFASVEPQYPLEARGA